MPMNRRAFLKGLAATASGLLVPSGLVTNAERVPPGLRRFWALDTTMLRPEWDRWFNEPIDTRWPDPEAITLGTFDWRQPAIRNSFVELRESLSDRVIARKPFDFGGDGLVEFEAPKHGRYHIVLGYTKTPVVCSSRITVQRT